MKTWVLETAGTRIHGTTKRQPIAMFNEIEQNVLSALPDVPPELVWWKKHKLHGNCHIEFEKSFYSAPYALVSQELWVRVTETTVQIFKDHELVAIHPHLKRPGSRSTIKGHLPPDSIAYLMRDPTWCRLEGKRVGPWCAGLIEQLFSHRVLYNLRAAQSVIGLEKKYGPERLEKACHRAVKFGTPKYGTVKTILERGLDRSLHLFVTEESMNKDLNPVYTGSGKFCRDSKTLLH